MSSCIEKNLGDVVLQRMFFLTLSLFIALWGIFTTVSISAETQIQGIDRHIKELEAMKRGYVSKALRHEDYAQRLQFEDRAYLETRRHIELAQEYRAKAAQIQVEIDQLKEKRKMILEKNAGAA